jgi:hypothetical protein
MLDVKSIAEQVKHNCNISDARFWGFYSPCGLLLRLRNLYKLEHGITLWEKVSQVKIADWIGRRETLWDRVSSLEFQPIEINNRKYHPFNVKGINKVLIGEGLFYGAGYGNLLKPAFIFAEISESRRRGRYHIFFLNKELARDLMSSPAMLQGTTIIARNETMKMLLWDKLWEMSAIKHNSSLTRAFSEYGIVKKETSPEIIRSQLEHVAREEMETYIFHELGEASQRSLLGTWWKQLLISLPYSRAELFLRGLKDVLADTCSAGMLKHIITQKKTGSLGFYLALLGGYRKAIFPNIISAYETFVLTGDWDIIEQARAAGYKKARNCIGKLRDLSDKGNLSSGVIEDRVISLFM